MKLLVLYRPNSEYARPTEEYLQDFRRLHPEAVIEALDVDSSKGIATAELYDIVSNPTLIVLDSTGQLIHAWTGTTLPLMDEVAGYIGG